MATCPRSLCLYVAAVLCCSAIFANAQALPLDGNATKSEAEAIREAKAACDKDPSNSNLWEALGGAYHHANQNQDAVAAFKKALTLGYDPTLGKYNLATAYASSGDKSSAIDLLTEVVNAGLVAPIGKDPEFANLAGDARFEALAKREQAMTEPCRDAEHHPEYRQLDFWVGDWEVFDGVQKVGDSSVQLILKDCVVLENWTDLTGSQGKSFNKYNPNSKKWEQFWVEDNGATNYFYGSLVDGEMRYELTRPRKDGSTLMRHMTFSRLPNGEVRQYSQASTDLGKTWSTEYDFTYHKRQ